jgi:aryl-alcohol dehydrogenase-like predicted oxidoreductase
MTQPSAGAAGHITVGDLTVHRMGFGAMRVTGPGIWGDPPDRERAKGLLRRAVELGVDIVDTADSYGPHVSEELIAEALYPYPEGLVIATKGGSLRPGPDAWVRDSSRRHLRDACEGSLRRLRLDVLPLYQLHAPDPAVPFEESVGALVELQQAGKIRHIGLSNVSEDLLHRAQAVASVVSVQNRYNVNDRVSEGVLRVCEAAGIAFLPWAPIDRGVTTPAVEAVAGELGATPAQVMLAWLLARSPIMVPIPGTGSQEHLEENVAAAGLRLGEPQLARLDAGAPPR